MYPSRTERMSKSLPRTGGDAWVQLFEGNTDWATKQEMLAHGLVDLDASPTRPTEILDAYLRSAASLVSAPRLVVGASLEPATALPATLDEEWPTAVLPHEGPAHLAARLVACGAHPFATESREDPDLLDVALKMRWSGVVLRILQRTDVPDGALLMARSSGMKVGKKPLPWAHALAYAGRAQELKAWLSLPGMDANGLDDQGKTPLFYARTPEVVQVLCGCGADPGWTSNDGRTAPAQWENPPMFSQYGHVGSADPKVLGEALRAATGMSGSTPTERMHAWARNAPEDWGSLPALVQDQMIAHRVTLVQPQSGPGKAVEWGVLACLGLQLDVFYADARGAQRVEAWGRFGEAVPRALLDHESTPGIPDGWALLVGLHHRCASQSGGWFNGGKYEEVGRAVVNTWSLRMLEGVPPEEWGRQWPLNMVKATAALLEQATPEQQGRLLLPLSDLVSDPMGWPAADSPGPALRQELAELILCTRTFRKALVAGTTETLLDGLKRSIGGRTYPLRESPTDLWTSMLALYAEHQRRLKASTNGRYDLSVRFLERVMKGWLETGVVPTGIQEHKVRAGLGMLAQHSPTLHTALTQARLQEALGTTDKAEIQPRPRVRL